MVKEKCKESYDIKRDFGDGLIFPFFRPQNLLIRFIKYPLIQIFFF